LTSGTGHAASRIPRNDRRSNDADRVGHSDPRFLFGYAGTRICKVKERHEDVKNWREHLRLVAILANVLLVMFLIGTKGWFMSMGFGVPLMVPPVLAIIALALVRRD
jgi:hypothetical protein